VRRPPAEFFQRAAVEDPAYAQAWSGLAISYAVGAAYDTVTPARTGLISKQMAERAIALHDRLAEPYSTICQSMAYAEYRWREAEQVCDAAIARNRNSPIADGVPRRPLTVENGVGKEHERFDTLRGDLPPPARGREGRHHDPAPLRALAGHQSAASSKGRSRPAEHLGRPVEVPARRFISSPEAVEASSRRPAPAIRLGRRRTAA
jgi:hypothetical protein